MSDSIDALLVTVQNKERRNRAISLALLITAYLSALILLAIAASWYATWLVFALAPVVVAVLWFISRKGFPSLSVSSAEASALVESAFSTKDRLSSFVHLRESTLEVDTARRELISLQLRSIISKIPDLRTIGAFKPSDTDQKAAMTSLVCAVAAFALVWFRPLSPLEEAAQAIREIVERTPDLPLPLQDKALDLAATIQGSPSDTTQISEALERTRQELSDALGESTSSSRDIAQSESAQRENNQREERKETSQENNNKDQQSPSEPKQKNGQKEEKAREQETQPQKQNDSQSSSQESSQDSKSESQKEGSGQQQGSQDQKSQQKQGESKSEQGSSGQQQSSEQQQSQQGGNGQQEESQDQQSDGQQGEGQGQGSGSAQGQNDSQQEGSKGSPSSSGKGQGEGEQKAGESSGSQQQGQSGSSSSQSGEQGVEQALNQLDQALQQMEQAVEQLEQQEQESQGQGRSGGKESSGDAEKQKGQTAQKGQSGDQESPKDNSSKNGKDSKEGSKGEGSGEEPNDPSQQESSKQGESPQNEPKDQSGSQNNSGKKGEKKGEKGSQGGDDSRNKEESKEQQEQGPQGSDDGAGEKSSMPDRNAKIQDIGDMGEEPGGEGLGPNTAFKESEITSQDEKFDTRYTGNNSSLEKNKAPAEPKTSIEDVTLAKPKGSKEKDEQPIPLEYRDILK